MSPTSPSRPGVRKGGSANLGVFIAIYVALILHASLYPATGWRIPGESWWALLKAAPGGRLSPADVVSNVIAYVPLGVLLAWKLRPPMSASAALVAATLGGALLSLGVETLQMFLPSRVPSVVDLLMNSAGTLAGATAALLLQSSLGIGGTFHSLREQ